jgi:hypothetical protein
MDEKEFYSMPNEISEEEKEEEEVEEKEAEEAEEKEEEEVKEEEDESPKHNQTGEARGLHTGQADDHYSPSSPSNIQEYEEVEWEEGGEDYHTDRSDEGSSNDVILEGGLGSTAYSLDIYLTPQVGNHFRLLKFQRSLKRTKTTLSSATLSDTRINNFRIITSLILKSHLPLSDLHSVPDRISSPHLNR